MNQKRAIAIALLFIFFILSFINFMLIYQFSTGSYFVTGKASTTGSIQFSILGDFDFIIIEPQNKTVYDFNLSDRINLFGIPEYPNIPLKVISTGGEISSWSYNIYSDEYGFYYTDVFYEPNQTIASRAGWNILTLQATGVSGTRLTKSVWFYVNVSSSAPIINLTDGQIIYACEFVPFNYYFNITDYDDYGDEFIIQLNDSEVFRVDPTYYNGNFVKRISTYIFEANIDSYEFPLPQSSDISKSIVHSYPLRIDLSDRDYTDTAEIVISELKINNIPIVDDIPNTQIYASGAGTNFYFDWNASDYEDGELGSGNLDLIFSFANGSSFNLFSPNSNGVINFTANSSTAAPRRYNLSICVNDTPLSNPHLNLSTSCGVNGRANLVCDNFILTITNINRAPIITQVSPDSTPLTVDSKVDLTFSANATDLDENPIDYYWYFDGTQIAHEEFDFSSDYSYFDSVTINIPCGVSGLHNLAVNVTDGLLYDNHTWGLNVNYVSCTSDEPPKGGGGGGGGLGPIFCFENWICDGYIDCLNLEDSFNKGLIFTDKYYNFYDLCRQKGLNDLTCGYESQKCVDFNFCNNSEYKVPMPNLTSSNICHYIVDPSCKDGILNCHDDLCELLIDCGGPCPPCPNCNDGIKNQNEEGIDCGGPCLYPCETETPGLSYLIMIFFMLFILLLILLILYILYRITKLLIASWKRKHKEFEDNKLNFFSQKSRKKRIKSLLDEVVKGD